MSETFIEIDFNTLKFQDKPILRRAVIESVKNPRYNIHCFDVMLIFSKLMRTIHISMTSTFQCQYFQCFTFKRCHKLKL